MIASAESARIAPAPTKDAAIQYVAAADKRANKEIHAVGLDPVGPKDPFGKASGSYIIFNADRSGQKSRKRGCNVATVPDIHLILQVPEIAGPIPKPRRPIFSPM